MDSVRAGILRLGNKYPITFIRVQRLFLNKIYRYMKYLFAFRHHVGIIFCCGTIISGTGFLILLWFMDQGTFLCYGVWFFNIVIVKINQLCLDLSNRFLMSGFR